MVGEVSFGGKTIEIKGVQAAINILNEIAKKYEDNEIPREAFEEIGTATIDVMNAQTPVKTGNLVTHNDFEIMEPDGIRFFNEVEYAGFVNGGTSRMPARPFFDEGLNHFRQAFPQAYAAKMNKAVRDAVSRNIK